MYGEHRTATVVRGSDFGAAGTNTFPLSIAAYRDAFHTETYCVCRPEIFSAALPFVGAISHPAFPGMSAAALSSVNLCPLASALLRRESPTYMAPRNEMSHYLDSSLHINWSRKQVQRPTIRRSISLAVQPIGDCNQDRTFFDGHDLLSSFFETA
jgi:hypothetical protein